MATQETRIVSLSAEIVHAAMRDAAQPISRREALLLTQQGNAAAFEEVCANVRGLLRMPPKQGAEIAKELLVAADKIDAQVSAWATGLVRIPAEPDEAAQEEAMRRYEARKAKAEKDGKEIRAFDLARWVETKERAIDKAQIQQAEAAAIRKYRGYRILCGVAAQRVNKALMDANEIKAPETRTWLTALVAGSRDIAAHVTE